MVFSHCVVHYTVSEVPPDRSPPVAPGSSTQQHKKVEADLPGKWVSIEVCSTCTGWACVCNSLIPSPYFPSNSHLEGKIGLVTLGVIKAIDFHYVTMYIRSYVTSKYEEY